MKKTKSKVERKRIIYWYQYRALAISLNESRLYISKEEIICPKRSVHANLFVTIRPKRVLLDLSASLILLGSKCKISSTIAVKSYVLFMFSNSTILTTV